MAPLRQFHEYYETDLSAKNKGQFSSAWLSRPFLICYSPGLGGPTSHSGALLWPQPTRGRKAMCAFLATSLPTCSTLGALLYFTRYRWLSGLRRYLSSPSFRIHKRSLTSLISYPFTSYSSSISFAQHLFQHSTTSFALPFSPSRNPPSFLTLSCLRRLCLLSPHRHPSSTNPPSSLPPPATSSGDSTPSCVSLETRARYRPLPSFPVTLPRPLFPFRSTSDTSLPLLITAGSFPLRLSIPRASFRGPPPSPTHTPSRTHRPSNAREQRLPRPPPRPSGAASASISRCRLPTRRGRRN